MNRFTEKQKQWIAETCLSLLNATKDCDAKPKGDVTLTNYKKFSWKDFACNYGMSAKEYKMVTSILDVVGEE